MLDKIIYNLRKGDKEGHEFHGNQWTKGITMENHQKYMDYVKDGGTLKPQDILRLRGALKQAHDIKSSEGWDKLKAERDKISEEELTTRFNELHARDDKSFKELSRNLEILNKQPNPFAMGGDENAPKTYHFTDPSSAINILQENQLYGEGEVSGLSTTTNPDFDHPDIATVQWYGEGNKPYTFADKGVRIDLDLGKIKEDGHKVKVGDKFLGTFAGEEELKIGGNNGLENADKYIKNIQVDRKIVDDETYKELKAEADKKGIPVVDKTKYHLDHHDYGINKIISDLELAKSFKGHKGRQGERGGSLPREATTVAEASKMATKKLGIKVNYGDIPTLEQVHQINETLFALHDKFGMPKGLTHITTKDLGGKSDAGAIYQPYADGTAKIIFNKRAFVYDQMGGLGMSDLIKTDSAPMQHVIAHEMGHAYSYRDLRKDDRGFDAFAQSISNKAGGSLLGFGYEKVQNDIPSKFGMTNKYEFFAESFVQAHLTNKKLTDYQKEFLGEYSGL